MKKSLMVLGLALLATMASAQTNVMTKHDVSSRQGTVVQRVEKSAVDYKASIFTKAFGTNVGDTIPGGFWNFDNLNGVVYGNAGKILAGDSVYVQDADNNYEWTVMQLRPHNVIGDASVLMFMADTGAIVANASVYSGAGLSSLGLTVPDLATIVWGRLHSTNFFFMCPTSLTFTSGLQPSCYVKMPAIPNPNVGNLYEVRFNQCLYKFVEDTWIDFRVGENWYAVQTNVRFIDATVNSWCAATRGYTMPVEFGMQDSLQVRMRYGWHNIDGTSSDYGYFWAFDNVAIVRAPGNHWYTTGDQYVDGGYGTIPMGFNVPLAWYGSVFNDGIDTIAAATATVYHKAPSASSFTALTQKTVTNLFPSVTAEQKLVINERGWLDSTEHPGWFGYSQYFDDTTNTLTPSTYGMHGLPTTEIGLNKITITGTVNNSSAYDDIEFDTIGYRVVDVSGGEGTNLIEGYRWAHDNGIVPVNSIYKYGNFYNAAGGRVVTENGNYNSAGYQVYVRYTTPDVIPTDPITGEPWVIRGMEIMPRTDTNLQASMIGSRILPMIGRQQYIDSSDGDIYSRTLWLSSNVTGLSDDYVYTVNANDLNEGFDLGYGRIAPGDDYNAVNIRFPSQPALVPNAAYMVGYYLAEDGWFAAARHLYGYTNSAGSVVRYNADPDLYEYYAQFTPNAYDVSVYDAFSNFPASSHPYWPMIRLIVGPREELDTFGVAVVCPATDESFVIGAYVEGTLTNVCNDTLGAVEGSDMSFIIFGSGDSTSAHPGIIDNIIIDGQTISVNNEDDFYGDDYTITEEAEFLRNANGDLLLTRAYYRVTLSGITDNRSISASGHLYPFNLGIEGEAVEVSLGLQPNPATNNVTINMSGVSGMVDCSIIDMSGRVVYSRTINSENSQVIDLSNVAPGAYFVRVTNDTFSKVEKLIVR